MGGGCLFVSRIFLVFLNFCEIFYSTFNLKEGLDPLGPSLANITFLTIPLTKAFAMFFAVFIQKQDILLVNVQSNKIAEIKTNGEEKEIGHRILKRNRMSKNQCLLPVRHCFQLVSFQFHTFCSNNLLISSQKKIGTTKLLNCVCYTLSI